MILPAPPQPPTNNFPTPAPASNKLKNKNLNNHSRHFQLKSEQRKSHSHASRCVCAAAGLRRSESSVVCVCGFINVMPCQVFLIGLLRIGGRPRMAGWPNINTTISPREPLPPNPHLLMTAAPPPTLQRRPPPTPAGEPASAPSKALCQCLYDVRSTCVSTRHITKRTTKHPTLPKQNSTHRNTDPRCRSPPADARRPPPPLTPASGLPRPPRLPAGRISPARRTICCVVVVVVSCRWWYWYVCGVGEMWCVMYTHIHTYTSIHTHIHH